MGVGFLFMSAAAAENQLSPEGTSAMHWLFLAYLFHTIGELCVSPTSLSFITKLAPVRYAALMMGIYFAAIGFGNKAAGLLGEAAIVEPITIGSTYQQLQTMQPGAEVEELGYFVSEVQVQNNQLVLENGQPVTDFISLDAESTARLAEQVDETAEEFNNELGLVFRFNPADDTSTDTPGSQYEGSIVVEQVENAQHLRIFTIIAMFSVGFGLLLLLFFKKLKKLTHGAEDGEVAQAKKDQIPTEHGEVLDQ